MKQHAIPQNILDVEFKLFTKFTIREFIYIAVGIGFGGIFLYLFTVAILPGIIAIPIFIFCSGAGLFLGLVPINDQKADVFLTNYFKAIRKPTLRVWRSKEFDEKVEGLANERGLTLTQGTLEREGIDGADEPGKAKIIGGTAGALPTNQFIEQQGLEELDQEEAEKIRQFEELSLAVEGGLPVQPQPAQEVTLPAQVEQLPQQVEIAQPQTTKSVGTITITKDNAVSYAIEIEGLEILPNSINFQMVDQTGAPVAQATAMVKDKDGSLIQVMQSTQDGLIISNKSYPAGEYSVEIKHDLYTFPSLYYILENEEYPAIRIASV